jgi:hypothetical protein
MRIKLWLRRILLRWTRKSRAILQLAQELKVEESKAFEIVAAIEGDSVTIARERALKKSEIQKFAKDIGIKETPVLEIVASIEANAFNLAQQIVLEAKRKADQEWLKNLNISTRPEWPPSSPVSGARLSR